MSFRYATEPFDHQRAEIESTWWHEARALFWEMGTGKTKVIIDQVAQLYDEDDAEGLLVIAPNGVHRNWIENEVPLHMPEHITSHGLFYETKRARGKAYQQKLEKHRESFGLPVLAMSYDAFNTKHGNAAALAFLKARRCMMVLDESWVVKKPGAQRTKKAIAAAKFAPYRRILNGTPVDNGPFDLYSQIRFLDPTFWKERQLGTYAAFKSYFAVIERRQNQQTRSHYDHVVNYRRLGELRYMLEDITHRVTKEEVLDLPPKLYSERLFELTPEQRALYNELRDEFLIFLDSGEIVTAAMMIVRMLRLQQITCGYLQADDGGPLEMIDGGNPRLEAMMDLASEIPHQALVWARFTRDIDLILERLVADGYTAVRYDGQVGEDERAEAKALFQAGDAQFFVGNTAAGGSGLTLHAARTVVYYTSDYRLLTRLQSEDRAHRIGQEHPVNYIDIVAPGTGDRKIISSLKKKFDVANQITGDRVREWLS